MTRLQIISIIKEMILHQYSTGPNKNIYFPLKITIQIWICIHEKASQDILLCKKEYGYILIFKLEVYSCKILCTDL